MQGLQQHVLHSWLLMVMSSKGIFTPTLYFSLWSWGQHGRGLLETQACSWWAWGHRVLPISMRWGTSASLLFYLPPEDLPPNQWSRRPQIWLQDSAWICCCPHISPQPFVLGANMTLETWILWLLHGSNILEVGRTKPLNAQGYFLNQSKLLIAETLSYKYLRIGPEVLESAWEQPIFLSIKECFHNALYSQFSMCWVEASWIFNYIHRQANVHKGECLIHFFKFL